jgi:protein phosphatase
MGGHLAGEIASSIAVAITKEYVKQHKDGDYESFEAVLQTAVEAANSAIYEKAAENMNLSGMGTTVSMIFLDGGKVYWAHVGDSRIYLMRGGALRQITKDHSLVERLLDSGSITEEEARVHPRRNVLTRAVGVSKEIAVDTGAEEAKIGDRWLLCTDGLTNMVPDEKIKEIIIKESCDEALDALFAAALKSGGLDNITAVLVDI